MIATVGKTVAGRPRQIPSYRISAFDETVVGAIASDDRPLLARLSRIPSHGASAGCLQIKYYNTSVQSKPTETRAGRRLLYLSIQPNHLDGRASPSSNPPALRWGCGRRSAPHHAVPQSGKETVVYVFRPARENKRCCGTHRVNRTNRKIHLYH
jgi:hypothetical protein